MLDTKIRKEGVKMKEKKEKNKVQGAKGRIAGKIIAALMVVFMIVGACSSMIYAIIYNSK